MNSYLPLLFAALLSGACYQPTDQSENRKSEKADRDQLINANRIFIRNQVREIDAYCKRKGIRADSTETGLRYFIERSGSTKSVTPRSKISVKYITSLLDGTECYRSDSLGLLEFNMSYDDVPQGLREGVSMMHEHDKAVLIIPAHLAYGLTGDHGCIPPNAAIVMRVELMRIE